MRTIILALATAYFLLLSIEAEARSGKGIKDQTYRVSVVVKGFRNYKNCMFKIE